MFKLPFFSTKQSSSAELTSLSHRLPAGDWSAELCMDTARQALLIASSNAAECNWAAQVVAEQIRMVSEGRKRQALDALTANRLMQMLMFQLATLRPRSRTQPRLVLRQIDFSGLVLPDLFCVRVLFLACSFDEADLTESRFPNCDFRGCSMRSANLTEVDFRSAQLIGCNLEGASMIDARGV
jgi:uncharacterized protein YjbI with pentapeptide repeats